MKSLPVDWEAGFFYLAHRKLGGATNGRFRVEWAKRAGAPTPSFKLPPGLQITLGNGLSAIDWTARKTSEPEDGELNTAKGVLDWKCKFNQVVVPHFNSKLGWVRRYLSSKELGVRLDFPGTRPSLLSEEQLRMLAETEVPGQ